MRVYANRRALHEGNWLCEGLADEGSKQGNSNYVLGIILPLSYLFLTSLPF
jgi:hypothetical protein